MVVSDDGTMNIETVELTGTTDGIENAEVMRIIDGVETVKVAGTMATAESVEVAGTMNAAVTADICSSDDLSPPNFIERVSFPISELLNDAKSPHWDEIIALSLRGSLFHWKFCNMIDVNTIQKVVLPEAQSVLGRWYVTIQNIVTEVPQFVEGSRFGTLKNKARGVYLIVGTHTDGRLAIYIGTTQELYCRLLCNMNTIRKVVQSPNNFEGRQVRFERLHEVSHEQLGLFFCSQPFNLF